MKVLFISNDPTMFTRGSSSRERMRTYAKHFEELHIISPAPTHFVDQQDNLFLYSIPVSRLNRVKLYADRAHTLIKDRGIELVSSQDPFELGFAALRAVRGTRAKLHVQVHTDFLSSAFVRSGTPLLNRVRCLLADRVLPKAAGIRTVSARIKNSLTRRYGPRIVEPSVIPVLVSRDLPTPLPLPPAHFTFSFVTIGRLEAEKRFEDIIAALKVLPPACGLYIIGGGRERAKLEDEARNRGLADRVVMLGERSDARALLASANAYVQASAFEGYGRTFIEAALANVPIVSTDVGIMNDVFIHEREALVVPPGDVKALAVAMKRVSEEPELARSLAQSAYAQAQAHLSLLGAIDERFAEDLRHSLSQ
jgi:glycosyltransferase involved in cell wall biosynthesis